MKLTFILAILVSGPVGFLLLWVILRLMFKGSILLKICLSTGLAMLITSFASVMVGLYGPMQYLWVLPVAVVVHVIAYSYITVLIKKPLLQVTTAINNLEQGKLEVHFDQKMSEQKDELGILIKSSAGLTSKLKEIISSVRSSAETTVKASQQLAISSQELSEGASEQASSVEEVSSSMEEMVANIEQNNDNAKQSESIANEAAINIEKNAAALNRAVSSMNDIAQKITIINDIAFQTNILALNAAVEAARAGEHGKGFAVVAAEVRKLAERSKIAAEEIDRISHEGVESIENASKSFSLLAPQVEKTSVFAREIANASAEQHIGSEQINMTIQQLNMITQKNAASSEEIASSAENLSTDAQSLLNTIRYFN
jgi:methyl-accepting chemotaxis protein